MRTIEVFDYFNYELDESILWSKEINKFIHFVREEMASNGVRSVQEVKDFQREVFRIWKGSLDMDDQDANLAMGRFLMPRVAMIMWLLRADRAITLAASLLSDPSGVFKPTTPMEKEKFSDNKSNLQVAVSYLFDAQMSAAHWNSVIKESNGRRRCVKGGQAAAKKWTAAKKLCLEIAGDRWKKCPEEKIGVVAKSLQHVIAVNPAPLGLSKAPTVGTIRKWVTSIAPDEARLPGRPRNTV